MPVRQLLDRHCTSGPGDPTSLAFGSVWFRIDDGNLEDLEAHLPPLAETFLIHLCRNTTPRTRPSKTGNEPWYKVITHWKKPPKCLGMAAQTKLSQLALRSREVRAPFADRGTWRFRTQDVEELARRRGQASNDDLPIPTASGSTPKPGADVFNFNLAGESDQVEIGQEMLTDTPSSARKGTGSKARTPTPKAGSDSDVRLVAEGGGVSFRLSDSKVTGQGGGPKSGPRSGPSGPKSGPTGPKSGTSTK